MDATRARLVRVACNLALTYHTRAHLQSLSDDQKRAHYDAYGHDEGRRGGMQGHPGFQQGRPMRPEDFFNMFEMGPGAGFAFGDDKFPYPLVSLPCPSPRNPACACGARSLQHMKCRHLQAPLARPRTVFRRRASSRCDVMRTDRPGHAIPLCGSRWPTQLS